MNISWAEKSEIIIRQCCEIWTDHNRQLPSPDMPEADKEKFLAMVNRAYPFGERSMHPYKVWRKKMRELSAWLYPKEICFKDGLFADQPSTADCRSSTS